MVVPNIAMVETYVRLLLLAPHSMFRSHLSRNAAILNKPGPSLLVLEILNYRLLSLYGYQGKSKNLMYDITKIISTLKGKRGDHRIFRLAENLCMNLIFSLREFFVVKKEGKGPTEFTETLNCITITTLAIIIKTRGIAKADQMLYLPNMLEQILSISQHTWSEKTLRYFPSILRDALNGRMDTRGLAIQKWQQLHSASFTISWSYLCHDLHQSQFPMHQGYLCAGAWVLMRGHPENINSANLGCVLREFSPEEVTANIYKMVDVLLHHIHLELQHGHSLQELILKASTNLAYFVWTNELLPLDILLLALIDRDDDPHALRIVINLLERQELQQRVKFHLMNRGPPEHWLASGMFKRVEVQKAFGNHLSWKERHPTFSDDITARLLPVIPLIIYRLIENDATDFADRLILRILNVLDLKKHINSSNAANCPPLDYFATLLLDFHIPLYMEASRLIKESWWLTDGKRSLGKLDSAVGYALLDPTWAAQDNTSTAIGNIVALLHSFFSNLPQEWLEGTHLIIKHLRPVTSVAVLRIVFRIMGPLLPRLANAHALFNKTLSLLLNIMVDVFGKNSQLSTPVEASDIADLIDFIYHVVHYEGQGGPVQANSKPRYEVLALCGRALENLRPDVQHLLSHLKTDINSSIYAATHPKLVQNPL
ncbi:unnamed protein product [Camellia sinensis]